MWSFCFLVFGQSSSNEDMDSSRRNRSRGRSPIRRKRYSKIINNIKPLTSQNGKQNKKVSFLSRTQQQTKKQIQPPGDILLSECDRDQDRGDLGFILPEHGKPIC